MILVSLIVLILIYLYHWKHNFYFHSLAKQIPGPKPLPIIGNALWLIGKTKQQIDDQLLWFVNQYNGVFSFSVGSQISFVITDPKIMKIILSSNKLTTKNFSYNFLSPWLGNGLLISSGPEWHSRRRLITPTFHYNILNEFVTVFQQHGDVLIDILNKHQCNESFNIVPLISRYTLDVICETATGTKVNALLGQHNDYSIALKEFLGLAVQRFIVPWKRFDFLFNIFGSSDKKHQKKITSILHAFTDELIQQRKEILNKTDDRKHKMLLDVLLTATINGKYLTNKEIRDEVNTFIFGGHHTTASAILSALYFLSHYSEVQSKVINEIVNTLGKDFTHPITIGNLKELKYLDLVIHETLRLNPPINGISRAITEDTDIGDNRILPKGGNALLIFNIVNKNEKYFPEPDKFIPERFLSTDHKTNNDVYTFTPFSAGPRNCIGQRFALLEIKTILVKILMHFELLPTDHTPDFTSEIVLRSSNGIYIAIKPRVL